MDLRAPVSGMSIVDSWTAPVHVASEATVRMSSAQPPPRDYPSHRRWRLLRRQEGDLQALLNMTHATGAILREMYRMRAVGMCGITLADMEGETRPDRTPSEVVNAHA